MSKIEALPGEIERAKETYDANPNQEFIIKTDSNLGLYIFGSYMLRDHPDLSNLVLTVCVGNEHLEPEDYKDTYMAGNFTPGQVKKMCKDDAATPIAILLEGFLDDYDNDGNPAGFMPFPHYGTETLEKFKRQGIMKLLFDIRKKLEGLHPEIVTVGIEQLIACSSAGYEITHYLEGRTFNGCEHSQVMELVKKQLEEFNILRQKNQTITEEIRDLLATGVFYMELTETNE